jgi:hypothetical protein
MPSRKRPVPESWKGARALSPESRAITLLYPDLHVRLWCNALGLNLVAHVDRSDASGRLVRTEIKRATWRGKPPKEEDVVLWACLALSAWLEARLLSAPEL